MESRTAGHGLIILLLVGTSVPAGGVVQASAQQTDDPIVVTGSRPDDAQVRGEARMFVRQIGAAQGQVPAARWLTPICPRVIGLSSELAQATEARIRLRAALAGARVAPARCNANLIVAFAHDGGDLVRRISAQRSTALAGVSPPDRRELKTGSVPIRWWYSTEPRSSDGMVAAAVAPPWITGNAQGGGSTLPIGDGVSSLQRYNASVISTGEIRAITGATVVVDVQQADGVPLAAATDYASMVALAELKTAGEVRGDTVLALFSGDGSVLGWTDRDVAFLKTLYAMPLDRPPRRHRQQLVNGMAKASNGDR